MNVEIDDSLIANLEWYPTRKINESIIGITTMIPIHDIADGAHFLGVYSKCQDNKYFGRIQMGVPFRIDRK